MARFSAMTSKSFCASLSSKGALSNEVLVILCWRLLQRDNARLTRLFIHIYALLPLVVSEPSTSSSFVGGCVNICVAFILLFLVISSLCFLNNLDIVYPLLLIYLSQIWLPSPKQWVLFQTISPVCRGMSGGRERTGYRKWENLAF